MKSRVSYCTLCLFASLISCKNEYEGKVVGHYRVVQSEQETSWPSDSFSLNLLKNKTFVVAFKQGIKKGRWQASDDRDRTLLRFIFDTGHTSDAQIVGSDLDTIEIWNPSDFFLPQLNKFSLYRQTIDASEVRKP